SLAWSRHNGSRLLPPHSRRLLSHFAAASPSTRLPPTIPRFGCIAPIARPTSDRTSSSPQAPARLHPATVHTHVAGHPAESSRTRRRPPGDARSATAFSPLLPDRIPPPASCPLRPTSDSPVARPHPPPSTCPAPRFQEQRSSLDDILPPPLPPCSPVPSLHLYARTAAARRRAA